MLNWAHWTTQQYQHHNITNIQQATWCPQQNNLQYHQYLVCATNFQVSAYNKPVNNYTYSLSVRNNYKTKQSNSTINSSISSASNKQRETNTEMNNIEDYYNLTRQNMYSVYFRNGNALSIDEIRNIFCKFGEISSCKQTGDNRGFVFVNFKTEDAARKCVTGLRDHGTIKLRTNKNNNDAKNNTDSSSNVPKSYDNPSITTYDSSASSSSPRLNNPLDKETNNSHNGSEKSYTAEENKSKNIFAPLSLNITKNNFTVAIGNKENCNEFTAADKNMVKEISVDEHDAVPLDLPKLITTNKMLAYTNTNTKYEVTTRMNVTDKPIEVIEAQEIIVANIEENYGVPAILHLLERYEPICASPIKFCKSHSIRYCHVFFTNMHQADAAECDFDNYEWSPNKKLIVLKVDNLALLASSI